MIAHNYANACILILHLRTRGPALAEPCGLADYLGCKTGSQCNRKDKTSPKDGFESLEVVPNVDDGSFFPF